MKRIKLLYFSGSLIKGGAEKRTRNILTSLDKNIFQVYVGSFGMKASFDEYTNYGMTIINLGKRGMIPFFSLIRTLRLVNQIKPDIMFSNLKRLNTLLLLLRMISPSIRTRIVITGISNNPRYHPNPAIARFLYKRSEQLIAISYGIKHYLSREWSVKEKRIHVVHNGINIDKVVSLSKKDCSNEWFDGSKPVIITVGRLVRQKNHDYLIESFAKLNHQIKSCLIIIGEGRRMRHLMDLVQKFDLEEKVCFIGYQENPYKYIARADLFVLSSRWEGFGNVLIESMACNTPVISTDIDFGPREIIEHGVDGFLVPNEDSEILTEQIKFVLDNRNRKYIEMIIHNARMKVQKEFSSDLMVKKYQEYFLGVYNNNNS